MFTLPLRQASHRGNELDQKFITPSLQETKQGTAIIEEIEEVQLSDYHPTLEQPQGTTLGHLETIAQKLLPSTQQEDALMGKPPAYKSCLASVINTPSPPPVPPTPRLRPIKHPYIRSQGCNRKEKQRTNSFTAPGILPLTPPATPPTKCVLSDTDDIPRLSLKRARSLSSDDEETPTRGFRETKLRKMVAQIHPWDLMHLRHVWHHGRVYLVDPEEDGQVFECLESHGCVWVEVDDMSLAIRLRKKRFVQDEMMRRRWGSIRRHASVGGSF